MAQPVRSTSHARPAAAPEPDAPAGAPTMNAYEYVRNMDGTPRYARVTGTCSPHLTDYVGKVGQLSTGGQGPFPAPYGLHFSDGSFAHFDAGHLTPVSAEEAARLRAAETWPTREEVTARFIKYLRATYPQYC